ncbi:MAG: glycoside hydrolase family 65 protein [Candidatus Izemoplasmataceae bacterium]
MILKRHNRLGNDLLFVDETIFTTQNRYLGVRGNFEEQAHQTHHTIRGTYINGIYDKAPIQYGEEAYGFPKESQTLVNGPDAQTIIITVDGEPLTLERCKVIDLRRYYHIEEGLTVRKITYQTIHPYTFTLTFKRLAHLIFKELFMIDVTIESHDYEGEISIFSSLNTDVENFQSKDDPRASGIHGKRIVVEKIQKAKTFGFVRTKTKNTHFDITSLMWHSLPFIYEKDKQKVYGTLKTRISKDKPITFTKKVLYGNSLDHHDPEKALKTLRKRIDKADLYQLQKEALDDFLTYGVINIDSLERKDTEDIMTYNLYQLYTSGGANNRTNIPAKGLSGEGYEGHTFWDTEIYMIPFFMQVDPAIAKNLLLNRYEQIPHAKKEAEKLGVFEGIKFAWRTINGEETSAYYPAGTAQYHINADIAYAYIKNYQLHKEFNFFLHQGLKILIQTARFYKEVLFKKNGKYHLHHVTGPDEYTAVVDNNYYTNSMIKYQLDFMLNFINKYPEKASVILHALGFTEEERALYQDISEHIVLNYDSILNIDVQDDSFLSKKPWDFVNTPKDKHPLLLHYHPLTIYRHKVLKQADTVLSHFLLNNRPLDIQLDSFNYYEAYTTHDSSLSSCIHAAIAARLGLIDKSYAYFKDALALDLDNTHKNTHLGLHVANLGGNYLALVYGFIGFEVDETIKLNPRLPKEINRIQLNLRANATTKITVDVTHDQLSVKSSKDINIEIYGELVNLEKDHEHLILLSNK